MKKFMVLLVVVVMVCAAFIGCSPTQDATSTDESDAGGQTAEDTAADQEEESTQDYAFKVGFVNLTDNDANVNLCKDTFVAAVTSDEFKERVGFDQNVEAIALDSQLDIATQTSHVENLIAEGVDMIFMIGVDQEGSSVSVEACNKAGIPIFMVATESTSGDWKFIGFNELDYGRYQGRWAAENVEEGAKLFYLHSTPGREAFIQREEGFFEGIADRTDIEHVATGYCPNELVEEAMQVTEDWIQAYDEIDVIAAQNNMLAKGAIEALKAADLLDDVVVISGIHTGTWDADLVKDGEAEYAVYVGFDVLGNLCADVCARIYLGEEVAEKEYIELYDVTIDNVYDYFPE